MYQRILVAMDGSATAERGLDEAIALARLSGARLRLIHVVDDVSFTALGQSAARAADWRARVCAEGAALLDTALRRAQAAGVDADSRLQDIFAGPVDELVLREAHDWPADLIVLGTAGRRGAQRLLLGSSAERIARQSPVPVLLVRHQPG